MKDAPMDKVRRWLPVIIVLFGVFAGYVRWQSTVEARNDQLADAVAANSKAIEKLSVAMERMTDLMITDARHDTEISALRRDLNVMWDEIKSHTRSDD